MPDKTIRCADCGAMFAFTELAQAQFAERGWQPPKRCRPCQRAARERRDELNAARLRVFDRS